MTRWPCRSTRWAGDRRPRRGRSADPPPRRWRGRRPAARGRSPCASTGAKAPRSSRWPRWRAPRPRSTGRTRGWRWASPSRVRERHMNRPVTEAGTMLAAVPPSVTMPWTWSPGRSCWRSRPMATWASVMASAALTPSQGAAEAWASLPEKCTSKWETARQVAASHSAGQGWTIIAAWTPSKAPRSSSSTLPPPPSSAGVPTTFTVSPRSSATAARARAAPTAAGGDDVVAAGVTDPGQGVVLGAEGDGQRPVPGRGLESGRQVADALGHGEAPVG